MSQFSQAAERLAVSRYLDQLAVGLTVLAVDLRLALFAGISVDLSDQVLVGRADDRALNRSTLLCDSLTKSSSDRAGVMRTSSRSDHKMRGGKSGRRSWGLVGRREEAKGV